MAEFTLEQQEFIRRNRLWGNSYNIIAKTLNCYHEKIRRFCLKNDLAAQPSPERLTIAQKTAEKLKKPVEWCDCNYPDCSLPFPHLF